MTVVGGKIVYSSSQFTVGSSQLAVHSRQLAIGH
jgi:hypothetical protein